MIVDFSEQLLLLARPRRLTDPVVVIAIDVVETLVISVCARNVESHQILHEHRHDMLSVLSLLDILFVRLFVSGLMADFDLPKLFELVIESVVARLNEPLLREPNFDTLSRLPMLPISPGIKKIGTGSQVTFQVVPFPVQTRFGPTLLDSGRRPEWRWCYRQM